MHLFHKWGMLGTPYPVSVATECSGKNIVVMFQDKTCDVCGKMKSVETELMPDAYKIK